MKNILEKKIDDIFKASDMEIDDIFDMKKKTPDQRNIEDRKPRILFMADVKDWAWWIKSQYIKKYLSDEFDIDVICVLGEGATSLKKIKEMKYDLYFTYGNIILPKYQIDTWKNSPGFLENPDNRLFLSYADFLRKEPKFKKISGVTAHREKSLILPKMKLAGYVHANSKMLLKELNDMGFKEAFYVPNGVDADLFKPINSIKKEGELIVGHVGKDCIRKGQQQYILPSIKIAGCKSVTNLRTWMDKIPHKEMPKVYNKMDVFMVASEEDGTPNPALEAMACGIPVISNKIGNMPELIVDGWNGFIVPKKIGAYVKKIKYFKENRCELIRMGENARKSILEGWTWKHQSENYRNMFRDIFKGNE